MKHITDKDYREARQTVEANNKAILTYNKMIVQAEDFKEANIKILDEPIYRMIGICDYFREKYPNIKKTDLEIMLHYDMLEDKYGEGG